MSSEVAIIIIVIIIHQPKADTDRLHVGRNHSGRGVIEIQTAYEISIVRLERYSENCEDRLMKFVKEYDAIKAKYSCRKDQS